MSEINTESQNKKQRLGRGLGSLLGGVQSSVTAVSQQTTQSHTPPESRVWNIGIDKLYSSEFQPRSYFDEKSLQELASSIKEKGVIQPLVARKVSDQKFEIIAGERRWRAAQIAGLHEVPVIIKTLSNKDTLEVAIIENIQREDLSPIEEAEAYQRLADEFQLTQQQIAEKVGKERATITNSIRLLTLPKSVQEFIQEGKLSSGHAKVLLTLEQSEQIEKLAKKIIKDSLSVRKTEKEIIKLKNLQSDLVNQKEQTPIEKHIHKISEDLQRLLGTKVEVNYSAGKGKISIHFYSNDELTELFERIQVGCTK